MSDIVEEWRPVYGYEGYYEVSNIGRVRTVARTIIRSNGAPRPVPARIRIVSVNRGGYEQLSLAKDGVHKMARVHRLVAEAFLGPGPEGTDVCHFDGNRRNNRVENLRHDTRSANLLDKRRHGTAKKFGRNTHCIRGHEMNEANSRIGRNKNPVKGEFYRACRACARENYHIYKQRKLESESA